ncbi:Hsp20/alpha crystallin family protein [bacterium]|jgi:HSP20 family protein|nr:Hsp20/alpha crystallin family protein [bacterium]
MNNLKNSIFDKSIEDVVNQFFGNFPTTVTNYINGNVGAVNIKEDDEKYTLEVSIPGFKKEDISVELSNDIITISSKKQIDEKDVYKRKEFGVKPFSRKFTLPENANQDEISADVINGILIVDIKKKTIEKKSKTIL